MQRATQHAAHHATCDVRREQQQKDLQGEHDHGLKLQKTFATAPEAPSILRFSTRNPACKHAEDKCACDVPDQLDQKIIHFVSPRGDRARLPATPL
jgi:hypothetical protein